MIRRLLLAAALLAAAPVAAQTVTVTAPNTVNPSGQSTTVNKTFIVNADGSIATVSSAGGGSTPTATNGGASATTVSPIAGSDGTNTRSILTGSTGAVVIGQTGSANTAQISNGLSNISTGTNALIVNSRAFLYDPVGAQFIRAPGEAAGQYIVPAPSALAAAAIVPSATTAVSAGVVAKASAGNVYRVAITTGASAGYLMGFNATAIPADGAVTPAMCRAVAANTSLSVSYADLPSRWSTGITFVFSTTGCFSKTGSATAFLEWSVQ